EPDEIVVREVAADLDVAEEAKAGPGGDLLEGSGDGLDVRMVGRDPAADEAPRRRQPLDQVDLDGRILAREQLPGRVEARRPRTDDSDAQMIVGGPGSMLTGRCRPA